MIPHDIVKIRKSNDSFLDGKFVRLVQYDDNQWMVALVDPEPKWVREVNGFFGIAIVEQHIKGL